MQDVITARHAYKQAYQQAFLIIDFEPRAIAFNVC
jgi:hypothetical protein